MHEDTIKTYANIYISSQSLQLKDFVQLNCFYEAVNRQTTLSEKYMLFKRHLEWQALR